ncbi:sulfurtransferase complex subunit TusC [Ferrimonas gelatinilytica]|uniref:Sulfurtransferase complex subunit TusC n=1 Tax=Ferrimonas gelatinilytica TaxID=1255257 RepID=A0ABP9RX46_9GAMM
MTQLTVVFRQVPHGNASGREALDLVLLSASYEVDTAVCFIDEGVYQLVKGQSPKIIASKDHIATFGALPLYEVDKVFICEESLQERGLSPDDLVIKAKTLPRVQIHRQIQQSKQVLTF